MASRIDVDVPGLRGLANRMQLVANSLESDTGLFSDGTNGVEHGGLRRSINKFEENWSDRRKEIQEALTQTRDAFNQVAENFQACDEHLRQQVDAGGGETAEHGRAAARGSGPAAPVAPRGGGAAPSTGGSVGAPPTAIPRPIPPSPGIDTPESSPPGGLGMSPPFLAIPPMPPQGARHPIIVQPPAGPGAGSPPVGPGPVEPNPTPTDPDCADSGPGSSEGQPPPDDETPVSESAPETTTPAAETAGPDPGSEADTSSPAAPDDPADPSAVGPSDQETGSAAPNQDGTEAPFDLPGEPVTHDAPGSTPESGVPLPDEPSVDAASSGAPTPSDPTAGTDGGSPLTLTGASDTGPPVSSTSVAAGEGRRNPAVDTSARAMGGVVGGVSMAMAQTGSTQAGSQRPAAPDRRAEADRSETIEPSGDDNAEEERR